MLQYKGYYGFKSEDDFNKLVKGLMKLTKEDLIDLAISGKVSGFNKDVDYLLSSIEVDNLLHKTEDLLRESDAQIGRASCRERV